MIEGAQSSLMIWVGLMVIIIITSVLCFTQNVGHLVSEKLIVFRMMKKSPGTTLLKRALLALTVVICIFSSIYFIINIIFDEHQREEQAKKMADQELYNGVFEFRDSDNFGDLRWSNDFLMEESGNEFEEEEKLRHTVLGDLLMDRVNMTETLIQLNTTLIEKSKSLKEKFFNLPTTSGNIQIKLPVYEKIGSEEDSNLLFQNTLDQLSSLATKWDGFKGKQSNGKIEFFFSKKTYSEDSASNINPSLLDGWLQVQPQMTKFQDYMHSRKSFVLEYGYQLKNMKSLMEKYYEDKRKLFDTFDRVNGFCFIFCLSCPIFVVLIIALRQDNLRFLLVFLWIPVMYCSYNLTKQSGYLVSYGGILNTGCANLQNFSQTFKLPLEKADRLPSYIPRTPLEEKVDDADSYEEFASNIEKCGLGESKIFADKKFNQMAEDKKAYFEWWFDNQADLNLEEDSFNDNTVNAYIADLNNSLGFKGNFSTTSTDQNSTEVEFMSIFLSLSSATDFSFDRETHNSTQREKGNCSVSQDQWVPEQQFCPQGYTYRSPTKFKKFSKISKSQKNCFSIFDWSDDDLKERYSNPVFSSSCTNQTLNDNEADYGQFVIDFHTRVKEFSENIQNSLNSSLEYFNGVQQRLQSLPQTVKQLNETLEKEAEYVEKLSQKLFLYNQTNDCSFIKRAAINFTDYFCYPEMKNVDNFFQSFSILAIISYILGLILAILGCVFYDNPEDVDDYREMEMETVENFGNNQGKISYVSMNSMHDLDLSAME